MSHKFISNGQEYISSKPAIFSHNGNEYEARLIRLNRDMMAAYIYSKTEDLEGMEAKGNMYCFSAVVTMPWGEQFEVSQRLGDWEEHVPCVTALGQRMRLA